MIGEMGSGTLELTPWGEDNTWDRNLDREAREGKRYNMESGAGNRNTTIFNN